MHCHLFSFVCIIEIFVNKHHQFFWNHQFCKRKTTDGKSCVTKCIGLSCADRKKCFFLLWTRTIINWKCFCLVSKYSMNTSDWRRNIVSFHFQRYIFLGRRWLCIFWCSVSKILTPLYYVFYTNENVYNSTMFLTF